MIYLCLQSIQVPPKALGSTANTNISQMKHCFCPIHTFHYEIRGYKFPQRTAPELDRTFVALCRILPSIIFGTATSCYQISQQGLGSVQGCLQITPYWYTYFSSILMGLPNTRKKGVLILKGAAAVHKESALSAYCPGYHFNCPSPCACILIRLPYKIR